MRANETGRTLVQWLGLPLLVTLILFVFSYVDEGGTSFSLLRASAQEPTFTLPGPEEPSATSVPTPTETPGAIVVPTDEAASPTATDTTLPTSSDTPVDITSTSGPPLPSATPEDTFVVDVTPTWAVATEIGEPNETPTPPPLPPIDGEGVVDASGGTVATDDGSVSISFPPGAASESLRVLISRTDDDIAPEPIPDGDLVAVWSFDAYAIDRGSAPVHLFQQDLNVTIRFSEADLMGYDPQSLRFRSFDEAQEVWTSAGDVVYDWDTRTLTAQISHFSDEAAVANRLIDTAPMLDGQNTNLQTGASQLNIPIATAPGRGGLAPALNLSYDSGRVGSMVQHTDVAGWVGQGWDLGVGSIQIDWTVDQITPPSSWSWSPDPGDPPAPPRGRYFLEMDGYGGEMVPESIDGMYVFRLRNEKFIRIKTACLDGSCPFFVTDQNGTQYVFGADDGHRRWFGEYTAPAWHRRYYRQDLQSVTDVFGNRMEYTYEQIKYNDCLTPSSCNPSTTCNGSSCIEYVMAAYPKEIRYNFDGTTPLSRVIFNTGWDVDNVATYQPDREPELKVRNDTPYQQGLCCSGEAYYPPKVMEVRHLDSINVLTTEPGGSEYWVRRYNLSFHTGQVNYRLIPETEQQPTPNDDWYLHAGNLTLASVAMTDRSDGAYTTNEANKPTDVLSTQTFTYANQSFHDKYSGGADPLMWPHLMTATNGFGGEVDFIYASAPTTGTTKRRVVAEERHKPGIGQPDVVRSFSYPGLPIYQNFNHSLIKDFRGFEQVNEYDQASLAGNKTSHYYFATGTDWAIDALHGREKETKFYDAAGTLWHTEKTQFQVRGAGPLAAASENGLGGYSVTTVLPYRLDTILKDNTQFVKRYFYDALGHQTRVEDSGDVSGTGDEITTYSEYGANLDKWIFRPRFSETRDPATNTVLSQTNYFYDGGTSTNRNGLCPPAMASPCLTYGLLTAQSMLLNSANDTSNVYYAYDQYGNQIVTSNPTTTAPSAASATHETIEDQFVGWVPCATSDPASCAPNNPLKYTLTQYDDAYGLFPTLRTNPKGQSTKLDYNFVLGRPTLITGPYTTDINATNVHHSNLKYDDFGRLIKAWDDQDSESAPTSQFTYEWGTAPNRTVSQVKSNGSGGTRTAVDCADGFGRTLESRGNYNGPTSGAVNSVRTDYSVRGLVAATSNAVDSGTSLTCSGAQASINSRDHSEYAYDALGNVTTTTVKNAAGTTSHQTVSTYEGAVTTFCDEKGNKTRSQNLYTDLQTVVSEPTSAVANCGATNFWQTTYTNDLLGRLVKVQDNATNETTMEYDKAGRRTDLYDPNQGHWEYTYDVASNLKTQTDARSITTTLTYDELQRLTKKEYSGGAQNTTVNYTYDSYPDTSFCNDGVTALGRLVRMTDGGGTNGADLHCYDGRGRETKTRRIVDSTNYDFTSTYDTLNQLTNLTYPDGDVVQYQKDANYGFVTGMTSTPSGGSSETLATSGLATAFGAPDKYTLGTTTSQITDFTYDFRNRLTRIQNGTSGTPGANEDLELVYDAASNVTSVTDHADSNEFVEYAYDQLHRLTQMKVNSTVSAEYTYSSIGNLTRKKEGTSGADRTLNYPTSSPTAERPHAVTSTTVNNATELTLGYDANGNVTSQGSETYVYDASNLLYQRSVTSGTMSYIRNGSGGLVKRTNSTDGSSTVYIGGLYEKESSGKVIKYYQFYGQTIARREKPASGSATLTYLLHDHLGSTYRQLASTGSAIGGSMTKYWPYGGVRVGGTTLGTDKKFTGQRQEPGTDALGLYDYGARFYSTTVGRFMGVDPIAGGGSQTSNAYMYVSGNPLRHTDPTGMCQTGSCPGDKEKEAKEQTQNRHYDEAAADDWTSAPAMEPYAPCVECLILVAAALSYQEAAATQAWTASATMEAARVIQQEESGGGGFWGAVKGVATMDNAHLALDVAGMAPVIGEAADGLNAGLYAAEGDYTNAALSLGAMVPVAGNAATAGKLALKYGDEAALVAKNGVKVYEAVDSAGNVRYVGLTNDLGRRATEHADRGWSDIREVKGLGDLTRDQARGVEQVLIERHGIQNLDNKINSIASANPSYDALTTEGAQRLGNAGY